MSYSNKADPTTLAYDDAMREAGWQAVECDCAIAGYEWRQIPDHAAPLPFTQAVANAADAHDRILTRIAELATRGMPSRHI